MSIVSTFALMKVMGYTLNQLTMLALTLMVGIVVIDDAIIVLENIYRFIEEKGMPPFEAAIEGTKEIGLAVMATTLSLMAVFVPVGFMGGIVGRFMSSFGLTAAFAIAVSLLVSFTLTPMLSSRFITAPPTAPAAATTPRRESRLFRPIDRAYMAMLRWSMAHRGIIVLVCVLVIASIVPLFMAIGKNFTPGRRPIGVPGRRAHAGGIGAAGDGHRARARRRRAARLPGSHRYADHGRRGGGGMAAAMGGGGAPARRSTAARSRHTGPAERAAASQQDADGAGARGCCERYPDNLRTSVQPGGGPRRRRRRWRAVRHCRSRPDAARPDLRARCWPI